MAPTAVVRRGALFVESPGRCSHRCGQKSCALRRVTWPVLPPLWSEELRSSSCHLAGAPKVVLRRAAALTGAEQQHCSPNLSTALLWSSHLAGAPTVLVESLALPSVALPLGADPRTEQQVKGTDPRTGTLKVEKWFCPLVLPWLFVLGLSCSRVAGPPALSWRFPVCVFARSRCVPVPGFSPGAWSLASFVSSLVGRAPTPEPGFLSGIPKDAGTNGFSFIIYSVSLFNYVFLVSLRLRLRRRLHPPSLTQVRMGNRVAELACGVSLQRLGPTLLRWQVRLLSRETHDGPEADPVRDVRCVRHVSRVPVYLRRDTRWPL